MNYEVKFLIWFRDVRHIQYALESDMRCAGEMTGCSGSKRPFQEPCQSCILAAYRTCARRLALAQICLVAR